MTQEDRESQGRRERKSLLKKYDIPLSSLDFGYIKALKNVKELEKIYKILKSNETGHFPALLQCAETRLKDLSPNNKLLRKAVGVVPKDCLDKSERDSYLKEIEDWKYDMDAKEAVLRGTPQPSHILQPIRRARTTWKIENSNEDEEKKDERIKSCDYKSWDTYDADKECLRLELEEEKRLEEKAKEERLEKEKEKARSKMSLEEAEIHAIKDHVCTLTSEEREVLALKEKDIGNEFYKTHHLDEALKHYTRSVYIYPTVLNHNNRAATYLKQCKFSKALADLNIALQMDPNNVKARYRRAVAYQHKNEFQKALDDIRVVLAKEPNHVLARHFADRLREDCSALPNKHRLRIKDTDDESHVEEVTEEEMLTNYKDKEFIEINEFGLPKIMCNCNGKYVDDPGIRHEENVRFQHIKRKEQSERQCSHQQSTSKNAALTTSKNAVLHTTNPAIQPVNSPEVKPSLAGGGRRLEIVELDSIYEECEEVPQTSCVVRDMRSNSTKDEKTNANLNIAQTAAIPASTSSTTTSTNLPVVGEFDKSDKMAWNKNVKESEGEEEAEEEMKQEQGAAAVSYIPIRANIEEMMEDVNDITQPDLELDDKATSTEQWLRRSVSSVNSDFGKCMDLNEPNLNFGDGMFFSDMLLTNCGCSLNLESLKPQNFLEKWIKSNQEKSPESILRSKACLLKGVCPMHIPEVFSLNLNEAILTDIINCLCRFDEENYDKRIILDYARSVTELQRFKVIICFVPADVKMRIKKVLAKLGAIAQDVQKAFG